MAPAIDNPYRGPLPYTEEHRDYFFGRDREAEGLVAQVAVNRLCLFYAPSGAGKSSLLHARLVPTLRTTGRFIVLPVTRVGAGGDQRPVGDETNIYVHNLLSWLGRDQNSATGNNSQPESDAIQTTLATALARHLTHGPEISERNEHAHLLIIDQFEEILTTYPDRWREREDFFHQLADALFADESLWVLLTLREEYVGALDRYAWILPGKLRSRFYMRRLNQRAALEAIRKPAEMLGRPFAPGVAEQLVKDLSRMRLPEDAREMVSGEYVEPIQLQVVCQRLWENLRSRPPGPITTEDLAELGDVNQALAQFYDDEIRSVVIDPAIPVTEREVRQWFSDALITPAGTRGTVFQEAETTGGLDNRAVARFEERHLIRGEPRAGGKWYELVHDRLIEPIQESNSAWFTAHQSPITQAAHDWLADGRNPAKLYSGSLLAEARAQLQKEPEFFSELEEEFIAAGMVEQAHRGRRFRIIVAVTSLVVLTMIGFAVWASLEADSARRAEILALTEAERAEQASATAIAARAETEALLDWIRSERLAAQARSLHPRSPPRALLLAIESIKTVQEHSGAVQLDQPTGEQTLRDLLGQTGGLSLVGHTDTVLAVAFSPQGDRLASAGADTTIRLWSAAELTTTQRLAQHVAFVNAVAFSPDGTRLASAGGDGMVLLWDAITGQAVDGFQLESSANALAFSPDGRQLAAAGDDGAIFLLETASNTEPALWARHDGPVYAVAFSPTGDQLASAGFDLTIRLWQTDAPGSELRQLAGHRDTVTALAFHPRGDWLASASFAGEVFLWDLSTGEIAQQFPHDQPVWAVAFTPDGRGLVTGSDDNILRWWEDFAAPTARPRLLYGHEDAIRALAFDPASGRLASGSSDETVRVWDLNSPFADPRVLYGHTGSVNKAAFSRDGNWLASAGDDGIVRLWRMDEIAAPPVNLGQQDQPIWSLAFSPDNRFLANTDGPRVRVRTVETGEELPSLDATEDDLYSITFGGQGEWLAAAGIEGVIRLWRVADLAAGPELLSHHHSGAIWSLAFAPGGERLASTGEDGEVWLWDLATPAAEPQPLLGEAGPIWSVAFSPDGQWLAAAGADTNIRLWNTSDFTAPPILLGGHEGPVWYVTFSADGRWLASAGGDHVVRLWEMMQLDATPIVLRGHTDPVNVAVFHPGGEWLASGSVDQTIRLWTLPVDSLLTLACRTAGRNLSGDEWSQSFGDGPPTETCTDLPPE